MNRVVYLVVLVLILAAGCASSNRMENESFRIETEPKVATATLSTGQTCLTPCSFDLPRGKKFSVSITKEGYKTVTTAIDSVETATGGKPMSASVGVGGIFRVPVGGKAGSSFDLKPNPLVVELELKN